MIRLVTAHTAGLDAATRGAARALLHAAFDDMAEVASDPASGHR